MCKDHDASRRGALKILGGLPLIGMAAAASAAEKAGPAEEPAEPAKAACDGAGTPLQFAPKSAPDPTPLKNELKKYPTCPYCGMNRTQWQHSRHLVHYDDDLVDGTCSIHCLAISLSLNIDRGPKAIYVADFGSDAKTNPLVLVDEATYVVGSSLKGTMTMVSKMAFADKAKAEAVVAEQGGELMNFEEALELTYLGMATDAKHIRKRRAERRNRGTAAG